MGPHITPFEFEGDAWFLNDKEIKNTYGITTLSIGARTNLLTINSAQPEHVGVYICKAVNKGGEAIHSAELFINGTTEFI